METKSSVGHHVSRIAFGFLLLFLVTAAASGQPDASNPRERTAKIQALRGSVHGAPANQPLRLSLTKDHYLRSVGAPPAGAIAVDGVGLSPEAQGRMFIDKWGDLFFKKNPAIAFKTNKINESGSRAYLRMSQTWRGLNVFASGLTIQVNKLTGVESTFADLLREAPDLESGKLSTIPAVSADAARQTAIAVMAKDRPLKTLKASIPELMVFEPKLLKLSDPVQIVWQTIVTDVSDPAVREQVLVNAQTGAIALHYTLIMDAKTRSIYDANNVAGLSPGTLVRSEGQPASGITDADLAYQYFGDTYDFYYTTHGRDSLNNLGYALSGTVRYCPSGETPPYANAFWDGSRMYFGQGFSAADDVVAHELTHGVTQFSSDLNYYGEPGAINESLSDMWGEWIDQNNGSGTDTNAVRWLLGEDVPGIGVIRNMKNPPAFNDPDRKGSPLWYTGSSDNGGVHTNSGVGNKLCYLLTDGDTFNQKTISGFGITKTAQLMYECQAHLLTVSSDYASLANALVQAAVNLGYSEADRANIDQACLAVEIKDLPDNVRSVRAASGLGNSNIKLTWVNPSETGFQSVVIRRAIGSYPATPTDGEAVYSGSGSSITDGPLTIGTTYFYSIWSYYGGTLYSYPAHVEATAGLDAPDWFTELFDASDNDLDNHKLTLTPDSAVNTYHAFTEAATTFPTDPSGGTVLSLSDDSYSYVSLSGGKQVSLYSKTYGGFYVSSNGYVTFGLGDSSYGESFANHFSKPRIAGHYDDLSPSGNVMWKQLADRVAVTWLGVREYSSSNLVNFQIEMFFDGKITITWLGIGAADGLAGISAGAGVPSGFVESDLTSYPAPVNDKLQVYPVTVFNAAGYEGGPFSPAQTICTLTNQNTTQTLPWSAAFSAPWMTASPASGTLPAGGSVEVTLQFNAAANLLSGGSYTGNATFTNLTSNYTQKRPVTLEIGMKYGSIDVSDTIAPGRDLAMPFGSLQQGRSRAEHVTLTNTDTLHNLTISDIYLNGFLSEDFEDGLAQGWQPEVPSHWQVIGGKYRASAGVTGMREQSLYNEQSWADCAAQVTMSRTGYAGSASVLAMRASSDFSFRDSTGSAYGLGISGDGYYYVIKWVNGVYTFLKDWTTSSYLNTTSANVMRMVLQGTSIKVYANGNLLWSGSDASIPGPGRVGMGGYTGSESITVHEYDDVLVECVPDTAAGAAAEQVVAGQQTYAGTSDPLCRPKDWKPLVQPLFAARAANPIQTQATPSFSLSGLPTFPAVLSPGQSLTFNVTFAPNSLGPQYDAIRIESNDVVKPKLNVLLSGEGIADYLVVSPGTGLNSHGHRGGPFNPASITYQLANSGSSNINWTAAKTASWLNLSASGGVVSPSQFAVEENFDSAAANVSIGTLAGWSSHDGTGAYNTDATVNAGTTSEPAHSSPNYMRLVGYNAAAPASATRRIAATVPITQLHVAFFYELQTNASGKVEIAPSATGPWTHANLNLTRTASNRMDQYVNADLTPLLASAGIGNEVYIRWSSQTTSTSWSVFNIDDIRITYVTSSSPLTVSLNAQANALVEGDYSDDVVITNTSSGAVQRRHVLLRVFMNPEIWVNPTSFTQTLLEGAFTTRTLQIGNTGDRELTFTLRSQETGRSTTARINLPVRGLASSPPAGHSFTKPAAGAAFTPNRLLVRFNSSMTAARRAGVLESLGGGTVVESYTLVPGLALVELPKTMTVEDALKTYNGADGVVYAEPDYTVKALANVPNDPMYSQLWGMNNTGQSGGIVDADIDAPEAWDIQTGNSSMVVAVIDTGINFNHPDLAPNMWTNPGEIDGNGIDDDGNGYIDDIHGYDFSNKDSNPMDDHFHGSHCSGTIGARGNDGVGVAGVNWRVSLMGLKFLNSGGSGTTADAILAVQYATRMGARVMSNSWGGGGYTQSLKDAIDAAGARDILFVAAAGNNNSNSDATPQYPAAYESDNIVSVMAIGPDDTRAYFSNWGATSVDLGAPGIGILSCVLGTGYGSYSGTSMACPHVAGSAALMWATNPALSYADVKRILIQSVDPTLAGKCVSGGRLNLYRALTLAGRPWIRLRPTSGAVAAGYSTAVDVGLYATDLPAGHYDGQIQVASNDLDTSQVTVPVSLTIVPDSMTVTPLTDASIARMVGAPVSASEETSSTLANTGQGTISWNATSSEPWLTMDPPSGSIGTGASAVLHMRVNSAAGPLAVGEYTSTVSIKNVTTGVVRSRKVKLSVVPVPPIPPVPNSPTPAHGATGVACDTSLSWNTFFTVIEDFEDGSLSEYTGATSGASILDTAAHDGTLGLSINSEWMYRTDAAVAVAQGDTISYWIQPRESGRIYCGFGASSAGAYSIVAGMNTSQFVLQLNNGWNYTDLAIASQNWIINHWYRMEVEWASGGNITGRLYDSDGTTLLNMIKGTDTTYAAGGIAFRAFGAQQFIDTITRSGSHTAQARAKIAASLPRQQVKVTASPGEGAVWDKLNNAFVNPNAAGQPGFTASAQGPIAETTYDVYLDSGVTTPTTRIYTGPLTTYRPQVSLSRNTTYRWRVLARNLAGSTWGPVWSFTTSDRISSGTLKTTLNPAWAAQDGAKWHLRPLEEAPNPVVWHDSGETVTYPSGTYTLAFKTLSNWYTPSDQTVTIVTGSKQTKTGTYTPRNGTLSVTVNPASCSPASWHLRGREDAPNPVVWHDGGAVVLYPAGTYTLAFQAKPGWATPANQTVTIAESQSTTATATYTPAAGSRYVIQLGPGYNPVGPAVNLNYNAQAMLNDINSDGGTAASVLRYTLGDWQSHANGSTSNNFQIQNGLGYFAKSTAASQWVQESAPIPSPCTINLTAGINPICLPAWWGGASKAEALAQAVNLQGGSVTHVTRFIRETGMWQSHVVGRPFNNFDIAPGVMYVLKCTAASTWKIAVPVKVTNVTGNSVSISWVSPFEGTSRVNYGPTPALGQVAYDDRGASVADDTHHITISGLAPSTTYYFDAVTGSDIDNNGGLHYTAVTGPVIGTPKTDEASGLVIKADGVSPAEGTLVYVKVSDANGTGDTGSSAELSCIVDDTGHWRVQLASARKSDLSAYFSYSTSGGDLVTVQAKGGADGKAQQNVDTAQDSPCPSLYLSTTSLLKEAIADPKIKTAFAAPAGVMPVTIKTPVLASNITQNAFTVSWTTDLAATGTIEYGKTTALGSSAADVRGNVSSSTHFINVTGLEANTVYYFDVIYGGVRDNNGGAHYTAVTGPDLGLPPFDDAYGRVYLSNHTTLAEGTIVHVQVEDHNALGTAGRSGRVSALVDANGYWCVPLGGVRNVGSTSFFSYSAGDSVIVEARGGLNGMATITIDAANDSPAADLVLLANHSPQAVNDTATCMQCGSITIGVLANDSDADGDTMTITSVSVPAHGTAILTALNSIAYAPTGTYRGPDTFIYTITDGRGGYSTAAVSVTVTALPLPVAVARCQYSDKIICVGQTATLDGASSYDPSGRSLTFQWSIVKSPTGSKPVLTNAASSAASIKVDAAGYYRVRLTVNNGIATGTADLILDARYRAPLSADLNNDNVVNVLDLLILLSHFTDKGKAYDARYDLNMDGVINSSDWRLVVACFGQSTYPRTTLAALQPLATSYAADVTLLASSPVVRQGETFSVAVQIKGYMIGGLQLGLEFDEKCVSYISWQDLNLLNRGETGDVLRAQSQVGPDSRTCTAGLVRNSLSGFSGEGKMLMFTLKALPNAPLGQTQIRAQDLLVATPSAGTQTVKISPITIKIANANAAEWWQLYE